MPVSVDRERCLNDNYKRAACRRCADACPEGCFDEKLVVDAGRCNDCGLCLAVCPVDAMKGENFPRSPLDKVFADPAAPVAFACRRRADSPWPCLGFLDGRLLLALVLSGEAGGRRVAVDDAVCAPLAPGSGRQTGGNAHRGQPPSAAGRQTNDRAGRSGRRMDGARKADLPAAFFASLMGAAIDTVREVAAAGAGAEPLPRHKWFADHADAAAFIGETPSPFFAALTIGGACLACGLCIRICPRRALTAEDHGSALDFYHHPARCTGCGLCAVHCPQQALAVAAPGRPETYHVARRELPRCQSCGEIYQPVGSQPVCIECLLKGKSRSILEGDNTGG
jgi:ferredoxin